MQQVSPIARPARLIKVNALFFQRLRKAILKYVLIIQQFYSMVVIFVPNEAILPQVNKFNQLLKYIASGTVSAKVGMSTGTRPLRSKSALRFLVSPTILTVALPRIFTSPIPAMLISANPLFFHKLRNAVLK